MMPKILVIDDEEDIRNLLGDIFEDESFEVLKAAHSEQALSILSQNNSIDLIVLDIWLDNSDMDGMQILKYLKDHAEYAQIPVLMISGHGNVEMAVNAMKIGAFDFIEKPFKIDYILMTVQRALEQKSLREENSRLKNNAFVDDLSGSYKSPKMASLMKSVQEQADSDARVMITGAIGTGKTRLARIIHTISKRSGHPLRFLDFHDVSNTTITEFFDHNVKGTVVIESIERLDTQQQALLFQYLTKHNVPARIIVTCSGDIDELIKENTFSSALYDRLAVMRYDLPLLKDRLQDIDILVEDFVNTYKLQLNLELKNNLLNIHHLKTFSWPGNIKQLKAAVDWMVFAQLSDGNDSSENGLSPLQSTITDNRNIIDYQKPASSEGQFNDIYNVPLKDAREQFEYYYLSHMLDKFDGNIASVATFIEMDRTALYRKLKSMNLAAPVSKKKVESL